MELNQLLLLFNSGRHAELEMRARLLVGRYPQSGEAWKLLGTALGVQGKNALSALQKAARLSPADALVHNNLGNALKDAGLFERSVASYRQALRIKPRFPEAHSNMGNALRHCGQYDSAEASFRRALRYKPGYADAYSNLANVLKELGRFDEAVANYRRALAIKPDDVEAYSSLLFTLNYAAEEDLPHLLEEARDFGRLVSRKARRFSAWQCSNNPKRLRVGLVSGDLCNHPVGYFLESLLAQIDPGRIELIAYPTDYAADELTQRIRSRFISWKPLVGLSDGAAAQLIHSDGVHVLLDLSGHTAHNRLPVFAWKPAPVQASWLGYFATTGVAEIDYLLADEVRVPESHRSHFSETIWYLPDTRLCFTPPPYDLPVAPLPSMTNGYLTFGSFQRLDKMGDEVLSVWGRILNLLPDSRLRWQCKQLSDQAVAGRVLESMRRHGIDTGRVSLHGAVPRQEYLAAYAEVDVILDTFPYPGGTTTSEALWMGVPTLTMAGNRLLSRLGNSLLTAAGLGEWVAKNEADYVEKAVALAEDLPELAALRSALREQVSTSPLFDARRFARNLEEALWGMWQHRQTALDATESETH